MNVNATENDVFSNEGRPTSEETLSNGFIKFGPKTCSTPNKSSLA